MKRAWKILIAIGVIMIVGLLASVIHHYQLRAATEAYIAELKAKGEPMDLAQVLPPPVSPDKNGAETFRKAAALFKTDQSLLSTNVYNSMRMVAPGKAMVCFQQPTAVGYNATNSWEEVAAAVARNKDSFKLLCQIVDRPTLDFGIHYERGVWNLDFTNLYLPEVKEAALRLHVAVLSDLHRGDGASAANDERAMLALVKGMRGERLLISELVRIAIANIALVVNWEMLQSTNVTDGQLASLQQDWASLEFFQSMEAALEMERTIGRTTVQQLRSANSGLEKLLLNNPAQQLLPTPKLTELDRLKIKGDIILWRHWWSYPDELREFKGIEFLLQAVRTAQINEAWLTIRTSLESNIAKLSIPTNNDDLYSSANPLGVDFHSIASIDVSSDAKVFNRLFKMEAAQNLVVAAIALKRYHLKYGDYPAALTALTPEFLSAIPRDPVDGQPLRYRLNQDGTFLLYSIGDDGKDDGGDPTPSSSHKSSLSWQFGRDWVWPQPATAEEIQKFYDNPPK